MSRPEAWPQPVAALFPAPATRARLERVLAWPDDPRVGHLLVTQVLAE